MNLAYQLDRHAAAQLAQWPHLDERTLRRRIVRSMKHIAEQILAAAFRNAIDVAWQAKDLQETARKLEATGKTDNAGSEGREPAFRRSVQRRSAASTGVLDGGKDRT